MSVAGAPRTAQDQQRNREWHHQRKARGLCPRCAVPLVGKFFYCLKCRIVIAEQRAALRAARRA